MPAIPGYQPNALAVTVQISATLCDPKVGLYGRTCTVKFGGEAKDDKGFPTAVNAPDVKVASYMYLHSDLDLKETYAICEVVLNVHDKTNNLQIINTLSLGLVAIKITDESG